MKNHPAVPPEEPLREEYKSPNLAIACGEVAGLASCFNQLEKNR